MLPEVLESSIGVAIVGILFFVVVWKSNLLNAFRSRKETIAPPTAKERPQTQAPPPAPAKTKKNKHQAAHWKGGKNNNFAHPFLAANLMGHAGNVLAVDCSSDGKYLVSCAEDRTIFFWDIKEIQCKGRKSIRINIEFDHATHIVWSPDLKAFVIHKYIENCIEVYKVDKKKDGLPSVTSKAITFDKVHIEDTVGFGIACNGRFMMSCSAKNDVVIWSLRGEQIVMFDTYMMTTMKAKISPCARYVVASGFVPDVKVWEILFDKTGKFKQVKRAFELTGHSSGVYDFAFDAGTSHIATVSKDGTWRLYYTKIDYVRGEMVQLVAKGTYSQGSKPSIIALSPKADVMIIGTCNNIEIFDVVKNNLVETIENIFLDDITNIQFLPSGKHFLVTGENRIRIFQNMVS